MSAPPAPSPPPAAQTISSVNVIEDFWLDTCAMAGPADYDSDMTSWVEVPKRLSPPPIAQRVEEGKEPVTYPVEWGSELVKTGHLQNAWNRPRITSRGRAYLTNEFTSVPFDYSQQVKEIVEKMSMLAETSEQKNLREAREELEAFLRYEEYKS